jgi:hypothetical protein
MNKSKNEIVAAIAALPAPLLGGGLPVPNAKFGKAEARALLRSVNKSSPDIFKRIVLIVLQEAHTQLGYKNLHACFKFHQCDLSDSYISLSINAAQIYLKLDPDLVHIDQVSEAIFRPFSRDTRDEYRRDVWAKVLANFDGHKMKRIKLLDVKQAISEIEDETEMAVKPKLPALNLDEETLHNVKVYAKRFSRHKLFAPFKNRSEWLALAKLIHEHVLGFCPLPGEVLFGSTTTNAKTFKGKVQP